MRNMKELNGKNQEMGNRKDSDRSMCSSVNRESLIKG
jgi:hypothetical protein